MTPVQHGMLFHSLYEQQEGLYVRQIVLTLREGLRVDLLLRAWHQVAARHPILRTSLQWDGLDEPVQLVHRRNTIPFDREDWRGIDPAEQQARLEEFVRLDKIKGINLASAPLMRLTLIQLAEAEHKIVWTFHHIMSDSYSDVLILTEVFSLYDSLCEGRNLELPAPVRIKDYVEWLDKQDAQPAESYWRQTMRGATPTSISPCSANQRGESKEQGRGEFTIGLNQPLTSLLKEIAKQNEFTLTTLMHGMWA
jgi:NRPS condensation-like uncharacterized protein